MCLGLDLWWIFSLLRGLNNLVTHCFFVQQTGELFSFALRISLCNVSKNPPEGDSSDDVVTRGFNKTMLLVLLLLLLFIVERGG